MFKELWRLQFTYHKWKIRIKEQKMKKITDPGTVWKQKMKEKKKVRLRKLVWSSRKCKILLLLKYDDIIINNMSIIINNNNNN